MLSTVEMIRKDVLFGFYTMEALCGFSKSKFGLVVGEDRLGLADGEVQADHIDNTSKKLDYDGKMGQGGS